jgi:hypothetical protein
VKGARGTAPESSPVGCSRAREVGRGSRTAGARVKVGAEVAVKLGLGIADAQDSMNGRRRAAGDVGRLDGGQDGEADERGRRVRRSRARFGMGGMVPPVFRVIFLCTRVKNHPEIRGRHARHAIAIFQRNLAKSSTSLCALQSHAV